MKHERVYLAWWGIGCIFRMKGQNQKSKYTLSQIQGAGKYGGRLSMAIRICLLVHPSFKEQKMRRSHPDIVSCYGNIRGKRVTLDLKIRMCCAPAARVGIDDSRSAVCWVLPVLAVGNLVTMSSFLLILNDPSLCMLVCHICLGIRQWQNCSQHKLGLNNSYIDHLKTYWLQLWQESHNFFNAIYVYLQKIPL